MQSRPPRILLASHATAPLPDVASVLTTRGFEVAVTAHLVETLERIEKGEPDVVVLQPLAGTLDGFEVAEVTAAAELRKFELLVVLPGAAPTVELLARRAIPADDLCFGTPAPEELGLRIVLAAARRQRTARLELDSITDFKTGLFNDRFFFQRLREEVARTQRHRLALSLLLLDVDDFKSINDQLTHLFGDYVLLTLARRIRAMIRQIDVPARIGGDEFALLLPNTDLEEAAQLANRLRAAMGEQRVEKDGRSIQIGLSMGIDSLQGDERVEPHDLLRRADVALLEAKRRGKNRVCLHPEVAASPERKASA